jgi:DnaJ-class molecular chaperone
MKKDEPGTYVDTECASCNGTGLYSGCAEPKGVAVVCYECNGTGKKRIHFTPFTKRNNRTDINTVRMSSGEVTYEEFLLKLLL